jgi:hypothetical protein
VRDDRVKADSGAVERARRGRDAGGVNIRPATKADERVLRELWEEFEAGAGPAQDIETWKTSGDVTADIEGRGAVYLAENDGVVGGARAKRSAPTSGTSSSPTSARRRDGGAC